jgi:peptidoglycan/LPS O-acetylase OafA/YrhL
VDVFYVLSGFLITGLLWEELQTTGRLRLGAFYARRARRLLPAAVVVLVVTVAASAIWLSPLQARVVAQDAVAAAFYVANYRWSGQPRPGPHWGHHTADGAGPPRSTAVSHSSSSEAASDETAGALTG